MFLLACIELGSYALTHLRPDLFDNREITLGSLRPDDFIAAQATASEVLGWDNPSSTTTRRMGCVEEEIATYDAERIRRHGRRLPSEATILIAGDSYTLGNGVSDDKTYPAELERVLKIPTANLGVSGYGADQALLKLEHAFHNFPNAKIVVLSILYDDVPRMMNSFRPILQRPTSRDFGLKPFVVGAKFHPIPGLSPYRSFETFSAAAYVAHEEDYWRRPRATFPYTLSAARMISLPSFWIPALTQLSELFGRPHYEVVHRVPEVQRNLRALYDRFMAWSSSHGVRGVVIFIPVDRRDQASGLIGIDAASDLQRRTLTFHNVTIDDPSKYAHKGWCHPTPEGYRAIADSVAKVIRPLLVH